jgi:hypothetical protein
MARNCPQGNKVRSNSGKPPDMSNFNIEFEEEVEVLESLPLGMVELKSQEVTYDWHANYSDWDQLRARTQPRLRDCYAMMAKYILTIQQPYPGDERYCSIEPPYEHFNITRCTPSNYLIVDQLTGFLVKLAKTHLANPHFNIQGWYVRKHTRALTLPRE